MRKIRIIARAELQNLFYSPIAWILLILFMLQCALTYGLVAQVFLQVQKMSKLFPGPPQPATQFLMTMRQLGLYTQMLDKLYLYLPLLTMGLISRELNSGTIRLLYSSPVKTLQIVLGKFTAMMAYGLLLIAILALFSGVALWYVPHADLGILFSALLGFFLLLGAYAAIGLFMSCLTTYQVVAAISTLGVFAALHYLGSVGQGIDFVRDLTWFLSLGSRTESMFAGLITSRDVLYFITIIVLFLCFSVLKLKGGQESSSLWVRISKYAGLLLLATGICYITARPSLTAYWDVTAPKTNTLAPATQALLHSTGNTPLVITAYVNLLDGNFRRCSPQARHEYLSIWETYVRFKPDIRFKYVYYYDTTAYTAQAIERYYKGQSLKQVAAQYAKTYDVDLDDFLPPDSIRKIPGLKAEEGRFVMQINYKGRSTYLRLFNDQLVWPSEEQISAALRRLQKPASVSRVALLAGGLERSATETGDRSYSLITTAKSVRASLINNGFDVLQMHEGDSIPEGLSALIIADPKVALNETTLKQVEAYITAGGNVLITGEPGKQAVLDPLLKPLGLQLKKGILVQQNDEEVPDMITPGLTTTAANMSQGAARLQRNGQPVFLPGATALNYSETSADSGSAFRIQPLLSLNGMDKAWLKTGKLVSDSAAVTFNEADGDTHEKYFVPAVALTRTLNGREQRIAVLADADFMSNQTIQLRSSNASFCLGMFKWFSNGAFPSELSRLEPKDLTLDMTDDQLSRIKLVFIWILPALLLIAGSILLIRRKRQ